MSVTHLNCASFRPALTFGGRAMPRTVVAHCLLVERPDGLLLVDTGFGTGDLADPRRLGQPFRAILRPVLDPAETAIAQLRRLGHDPADVTDVVLTHLDLDHAGGIGDFPFARVHVHAAELDAALHPTLKERGRYRSPQWAHGPRWVRHHTAGDSWLGLESVTVLGDDVLLVPLAGHSRGHSAVAVARPGGGWLLHAGDAYFAAGEKETPRTCPPGLRLFQSLTQADSHLRHSNQERLRELYAAHRDDVTVFSAHDPAEYAALSGTGGA
ncbi:MULTISPECIES: MBL fold metallo-hydrolase [Nocardioides]|uniref:Glyoxylase, beta-lactamase superfamily II n=1 Tax=Nocardioides lianchengensis TaxID=1045774 RepID=A0A1G6LKS9_9ACTN|nr:MBL fold metallo-hydrolase [Nocardioides lianchengensis]SDC43932.1 Glyoxylase, beta-lactamase superfamily II [Nocardioides lianchengensis]